MAPSTSAPAAFASDAASQCDATGNDAQEEFDVLVATREVLGLRLSERLEILEFAVDAEGRARAVEASGLAEVGDRLLAVNGECVAGIRGGLRAAVELLQRAERPMTLRFQSRDRRRVLSDAVGASAGSESDASRRPPRAAAHTFDYVLLSDGDRNADTRLFAALSGDGKPPSCGFRRLVIARPLDACEPLENAADVADKYLLVPDVDGCPAHQKALLAQEAGARGVLLVARDNKLRQVRLPPPEQLPTPLRLAVAMISRDSGERALRRLATTPPSRELHLGFVFSAECSDDKYAFVASTHALDAFEDDRGDPRRRPVAAGFLSVSVAVSASSLLTSATYEFLRPRVRDKHTRPDHLRFTTGARLLPVGKRDLFLANDPRMFQPCETEDSAMSPLLRLMRTQRELQGKIALAPLLPPSAHGTNASAARRGCSLSRQLAYYSALEFEGLVLWDADFPAAAHSSSATAAAADRAQASLPFVFISSDAYQAIRQTLGETAPTSSSPGAKNSDERHIQVEFTRENALHHQWRELAHLAEPANWPSSAAARERLLHRVLKDHDAVADRRSQLALAAHERRAALVAAYEAAHQFHRAQHEARRRRLEDTGADEGASIRAVSTSASGGSTITMVDHGDEGDGSSVREQQ